MFLAEKKIFYLGQIFVVKLVCELATELFILQKLQFVLFFFYVMYINTRIIDGISFNYNS